MLSCFYALGYSVEWRVINAAEYGTRRSVSAFYIYAEHNAPEWDLSRRITHTGVLAEAFPVKNCRI